MAILNQTEEEYLIFIRMRHLLVKVARQLAVYIYWIEMQSHRYEILSEETIILKITALVADNFDSSVIGLFCRRRSELDVFWKLHLSCTQRKIRVRFFGRRDQSHSPLSNASPSSRGP